jgi:hypothetical protein
MESTRTSISELPPYQLSRTVSSDTTATAPPPYTATYTPSSQAGAASAGDTAAAGATTTSNQAQPQPRRQQQRQAAASSSSTAIPEADEEQDPESSSSSSLSPFKYLASAKDAYRSHKAAKEADRKVQFYQNIYGFVPKNVMTEAEWKAARKKAPVHRKPFRARGYWVH